MANEKNYVPINNLNRKKSVESNSFLKILAEEVANINAQNVVPPMYRLGSGEGDSEDIVVGNKRIFSWNLYGNESKLSTIAGWNRLNHILESKGRGYLFLPEGTRNASSVLSGLEAYEGEKAEIVDAGIKYLKEAKKLYGGDDIQFSWKALAITPEQEIFVAPPHSPTINSNDLLVQNWRQSLEDELALLLEGDVANQQLIFNFHEALIKE